ncbi:MAG TPA: type IX secretion system membrane protein PorP/SprF [Bacteroidia bacterium]
MKKLLEILAGWLIAGGSLFSQQDPQYSQYMFNQVIINPAYIGSKDGIQITALTRKQWVNINGSPQSNNISVSSPILSRKMALGSHLVFETIGPKKWFAAHFDYCYRLKLGKGKLSFGLSPGIVGYSLDISKFDLYDAGDAIFYSNSNKRTIKFDLSAGLFYNTKTFYAGISATHLTTPVLFSISSPTVKFSRFYDLNRHYFITAGKAFEINRNLIINPSIMIKTLNSNNLNFDGNLNILFNEKIWVGASYRTSKNIIGLVQVLLTDKLKVGYSYDYGYGKLNALSSGSHEIMINYGLGIGKSRIVNPRFL